MDNLKFCLEKYGRIYPDVAKEIANAIPVDLPSIDLSQWDANPGDVQDCIVYGIGRGEIYTHLKKWLYLRLDRVLIFVEEDIGVLRALFETELGKTILSDDRVEILFYFKTAPEILVNRLKWLGLARKRTLLGDPRIYPQQLKILEDLLEFETNLITWSGRDYQYFGLIYYLNYFNNLKELPNSYDGTALIGKAKNTPAIIVGAGPSLDKNGHLLKELKKKGLIFAGGSSLPAIKQFDITPHFGGGVDPNIWQSERLHSFGKVDFPFIFFSRLFHQALHMVEGPKVYIPGGCGYPTESWINKKLGIVDKSPFKEGYSITHLMTEVAVQMGCNPIIYVGVDLSYPNNVHYAKGVTEPEGTTEELIDTQDIDGNPIKTRWMWIKEAIWIADYAKSHPDVTFINATEGGIGFEGVSNETLAEVKKRLKKPFNFKKNIQLEKLKVTLPQITEVVKELYESLLKLQRLLEEMHEFYSKLNLMEVDIDSLTLPKEEEWQEKLEQELAWPHMLIVFNIYCMQLIHASHTSYLLLREGMNIKISRQVLSLHLQKIHYLNEVVLGEISLLQQTFGLTASTPS